MRRVTCRQLIESIAGYVDRDFEPIGRWGFYRHFAFCRSCRAYLGGYRKTMRFTRAVNDYTPLADAPEDLVRRILRTR